MADFCRQCTIEHFATTYADMNEIQEQVIGECSWILCEGCGWHWFGPDGSRLEDGMPVPNLGNHPTPEPPAKVTRRISGAIEVPPTPVTDEDFAALPVLDFDEFLKEIGADADKDSR
jgi:hypothetical protein